MFPGIQLRTRKAFTNTVLFSSHDVTNRNNFTSSRDNSQYLRFRDGCGEAESTLLVKGLYTGCE